LTRTITLIALVCCLISGAAMVSILGRDSVPMATAEMVPQKAVAPVANRDSKHDKLAVALPAALAADPTPAVNLSEPLRQAYASSNPTDTEAENAVAAAMPPVTGALPPAKPKVAAKPQPQKPYALLSDAQIAGIKERLHLTSDQEYYWPGIETRRKSSSSNRPRCRCCSSSAMTRRKRCAGSPASSGSTRSPPRSDATWLLHSI
jgi:hypothetical protein